MPLSQNRAPSRREFLAHSSLLAVAAGLPRPLWAQVAVAAAPTPSREVPTHDTVLKFNPDGTPRPFAGNTVICHLPPQCPMRDAMLELHYALTTSPLRAKLGPTSTDSYHMTVFPGANDQNRTAYGWPSYVPLDASIADCSRAVGERIAAARLHFHLPLRLRVNVESTLRNSPALSLRLDPVDAGEQSNLRSLRDQLSAVYGFRLPDHATYGFHMTMSYQMAPFTPDELDGYRRMLAPQLARIVAAQPVLELGEPEYCTFPDMFRFDPVHLLATA